MNILVTGGSGFIGSNLCKRLLNDGNIVYCLDDFSTSSKENIIELLDYNFHYINYDVREKIEFLDVDQIYNLASPTAPRDVKKDTLKTLETNIYGTKNVLDLAKRLGASVLHISSIRVFEQNHLDINSCYTEGKRVAEILCEEYKKFLNVKIARLNNIYGTNMSINDSRVFPQFIMRALKNEDIYIYGDGLQLDSFCYIDDFINLIVRFMNSEVNETINVGGPIISILELAKLIIKTLNSKSEIKFIENTFANKKLNEIKSLKEILDWESTTSLIDGIVYTANYYKLLLH